MLPVKSNTAEQGCSPVSSNCVIWQGPALPCINLCNGDTISDVVYKVATNLCAIQGAYDLSDLDLSCLVTFCSSANPAPTTKTLSAVLDFIVQKVCCLSAEVEAIDPGNNYTEPTLQLPSCLQYNDPATGQPITQLIHSQYTLRLGNQFCELKAIVDQHTQQISTLNSVLEVQQAQIANLQNATLPNITPNCILTPGVPTEMNLVLDELENQFCLLRTQLGNNNQLAAATAQQCATLSALPALSQVGTMGAISGWNNSVTTMAQSFQNLWITVCDMRNAINDLKNCCGASDCSAFILDYTVGTNNERSEVTLFFADLSVIPSGYTNCNAQGSKVTIKDSANHTYIDYIDLVAQSTNVSGVTFVVSGSSLNPASNYTITVEGCVVKDGQTCSKAVSKTSFVPCPIITNVTATLI